MAQIIPFIPWNHIFFPIELSSEGILSAQPPPPPNLPFRLSNYIPEARSGYAAWSHSGLFIVAVELEHHVIGGLKGTWGKENSHHIKKPYPPRAELWLISISFKSVMAWGQSGLFKAHKLLHRTCPGVAELVELACVCIYVCLCVREKESFEWGVHSPFGGKLLITFTAASNLIWVRRPSSSTRTLSTSIVSLADSTTTTPASSKQTHDNCKNKTLKAFVYSIYASSEQQFGLFSSVNEQTFATLMRPAILES